MKAFLLVISLAGCLQGIAQQEYFVFIQSEKQQPFYVRMDEKNHSSSSTGHVILSRLRDSSYMLTIGFPQNQFPEREFSVRINKKDRGFELKNLGDKGWALFDLQSLELISPVNTSRSGSGGASAYSLVKKDDNFARLMAGVVNDTAVLYTVVMTEKKPDVATISKETPASDAGVARNQEQVSETKKPADSSTTKTTQEPAVVKTDPPVQDTVKNIQDVAEKKPEEKPQHPKPALQTVSDTQKIQTVGVKTGQDTTALKNNPIANNEQDPIKDSVLNPPALPVITVIRQYATDTGYHMVIIDDRKDSIDLFIPADVPQRPVEKKPEAKSETPIDTAKKVVPETKTVSEPVKKTSDTSTRVADSMQNAPVTKPQADTAASKDAAADVKDDKKLVMTNSDCRSFATTNDVDKLRVRLLGEKDSEARIAAAKKIFKTRCFTAQQIRGLSEMFPLDEQKYRFLETAYPFVSDTGNFKGLVSLLQDPVYVQRFRKLVRLD